MLNKNLIATVFESILDQSESLFYQTNIVPSSSRKIVAEF